MPIDPATLEQWIRLQLAAAGNSDGNQSDHSRSAAFGGLNFNMLSAANRAHFNQAFAGASDPNALTSTSVTAAASVAATFGTSASSDLPWTNLPQQTQQQLLLQLHHHQQQQPQHQKRHHQHPQQTTPTTEFQSHHALMTGMLPSHASWPHAVPQGPNTTRCTSVTDSAASDTTERMASPASTTANSSAASLSMFNDGNLGIHAPPSNGMHLAQHHPYQQALSMAHEGMMVDHDNLQQLGDGTFALDHVSRAANTNRSSGSLVAPGEPFALDEALFFDSTANHANTPATFANAATSLSLGSTQIATSMLSDAFGGPKQEDTSFDQLSDTATTMASSSTAGRPNKALERAGSGVVRPRRIRGPPSAKRRKRHQETEARRRVRINEAVCTLRALTGLEDKEEKARVLEATVDLIESLHARLSGNHESFLANSLREARLFPMAGHLSNFLEEIYRYCERPIQPEALVARVGTSPSSLDSPMLPASTAYVEGLLGRNIVETNVPEDSTACGHRIVSFAHGHGEVIVLAKRIQTYVGTKVWCRITVTRVARAIKRNLQDEPTWHPSTRAAFMVMLEPMEHPPRRAFVIADM
ncbi:uncharacterized protein MONBRDRAFT_33997 [Monosiga brevicollis MX1]|uniref:BHLH domain-containing protein n=1 Tax=Monosiga brevicollis TaxID=81824 RepID=A9V906_MONBE|nr:uncharacterized protein MONBRDRAFT_33997 [Monosiga brevicollis MX1]EDQ85970.1 predicted protein [Monosiga brevicollis MX1]|eukprot:XP_001749164.1 hypothetical protein [Monosiga brevicollis MX1]